MEKYLKLEYVRIYNISINFGRSFKFETLTRQAFKFENISLTFFCTTLHMYMH